MYIFFYLQHHQYVSFHLNAEENLWVKNLVHFLFLLHFQLPASTLPLGSFHFGPGMAFMVIII